MTKFIFHGGKTTIASESNINYFKQTVGSNQNPKILIVPFAGNSLEYQELFEKDKNKFYEYTGKNDLVFELASTDIKKLEEQILNNDILYIRGGDQFPLIKIFNQINLKEVLKNKVISGTSAGAIMWAKYYYSNDTDTFEKGLGFLDVKMIAHFGNNNIQKLHLLEEYGEKLEIITLAEQEFKIIVH